jgi:hypothetical protein
LYHILDKIMNDGWQAASKIPRRILQIKIPVKFFARAWQARTIPQQQMLNERYFAIGTRVMIQLVGYSTTRMAM